MTPLGSNTFWKRFGQGAIFISFDEHSVRPLQGRLPCFSILATDVRPLQGRTHGVRIDCFENVIGMGIEVFETGWRFQLD